MMNSMSFFVECKGILLPDGTVFGGGTDLAYEITHGDNGGDSADVFHIYQIIGKNRIMICDPMRYQEMRKWVHDQVKHYEACDMKLWEANHCEWDKATYKKLVTLDW